jgi:hypothetical protein
VDPLYSNQSISEFLVVQMIGAVLAPSASWPRA